MPIEGVQNYNITSRNGSFSNVVAGGVLGVAGGYAAKHLLPLDAKERVGIPYKSIINVARKETNKKMREGYEALAKRSEAQDAFVKMIKEKNFKGNKKIAEDLAQHSLDASKEFKKIIKVADRDSSAVAKQYAGAYHKFIKCMRPNAQFVGVGAAIGLLAGVVYNVINHNKQA